MVGFLLNMWIMARISTAQIQMFTEKGYITSEQATAILATAQL